jgi:GNAT superfamily N-acetyltransferase
MIRLAETPADFELVAEIYADVSPDGRLTAGEVARSSGLELLAGEDGYAHLAESSVTDAMFAMVRVRPPARARGVGSALLAAAAEHAVARGRMKLWGRIFESEAESRRWAAARGFAEITRDIDVLLTVAPGDGERTAGIVELADEHLAGAYAVVAEATPEVALPQVAAAVPFDDWLEKERTRNATAFVALDGAEVVGYAALYPLPGTPHRLENGLTAVKKSHRRRGIAIALKRAEIAWAAENGYTEIVTDMVEGNAGMRAVNKRLGYEERPAWVVVEGPAV